MKKKSYSYRLSKKPKYALKWWQWMQMPVYYILWRFHADKPKRKETFHLVLKGLEIHEHNFVLTRWVGKVKFFMCDHEGCYELREERDVLLDIFD